MSQHDFCRMLLAETMKDVRKHTTAAQRKEVWVAGVGFEHYDFSGPGGFFTSVGGCCKWDARASGWTEWLAKMEKGKQA